MRNVTALAVGGPPRGLFPNRWDLVAFPLVLGLLVLTVVGLHQMQAPLTTVTTTPVELDPANLPEYALRTTLRMLAAMAASLVFTFIYGTLAAKSRKAELVLVPVLDVLQSVPVLGYISFTVIFFMSLFPGSVMGAELACIFAIFTAQAWNMTFSFYQSLRTVPRDLMEATQTFRFTPWQRFWRLEVPFAMPGLIWNMMMSMSGSWFFVVAQEAINVGNTEIDLPGIGTYVNLAIQHRDIGAVVWAIVAMLGVILIYDQLLFRPLVAWADKFRVEMSVGGGAPRSWMLDTLRGSKLVQTAVSPVGAAFRATLRWRLPLPSFGDGQPTPPRVSRALDAAWYVVVALGALWCAWLIVDYIASGAGWSDLFEVIGLGLITLLRVTVLIALASVVWVPVGIMIGLKPRLAERVQPLAQFLAAFPANVVFPVAVILIVHFDLNPDIWLSPLIIFGTQWYILFNVVAGASAFPNDLKEACANFRIRGWQWWTKVMIPGIFPYYVTGAITASGGAWNASIVAEAVQWGETKLTAHGLGAYITQATDDGNFPHILLGITVMSVFVILSNRLLWRPLYTLAERRMRID